MNTLKKIPGTTKEAEEKHLAEVMEIAENRLEKTKQSIKVLAEELHEMQEMFDEDDKEQNALWHNKDARFQEVNKELFRAERARKKPFFGRIDFTDKSVGKEEVYYIGRSVLGANPAEPDVIDWRAPIASVYYDHSLGDVTYSVKGEGKYEINLTRKRTYEIEEDKLKDFYDSDVVANDDLLTKYLAKSKRAVLGEIIATIQQEQNEIIRKKPQHNLIVQGAAGSGKTTVAMHRISYILYNYELEFAPEDFYIIGSNQILLNYITGVLPDLDVYGVSQMTMEQLFVRLLYEDWDIHKYEMKPVIRGVTEPVKCSLKWFQDLEQFCWEYEWETIPHTDIRLQKTGTLLLTGKSIERILRENRHLSRADKINKLTEHLIAKLENEISGKYYSFSEGEKKKLLRQYEVYFGKREWKGSIFEMYTAFLQKQKEKGIQVSIPENTFDVYDLAALAYLYKRIKEDEVIREAGHVVIDEAQDFGMMVYASLKYCLSKCTYTIMGDVSQNISLDYGLNDWEELRKCMLPGEFDYFGLLRKSYRNTVEISKFATDILRHGSFHIYPVEPIIRHGSEVVTVACKDQEMLIQKTVETVQKWQADGLETIAVVCNDEDEVSFVKKQLEGKIDLLSGSLDQTEFGAGVMVLSLAYTKGLEFDAVLIYDASAEKYPLEDGYVKRFYVACTRALHQLVVLYQGTLTELITAPIPEKNRMDTPHFVKPKRKKYVIVEPEKTQAELDRDRALESEKEMARRNQIGPKRIIVEKKQMVLQSQSDRVKMEGAKRSIPTYLERRQKELLDAKVGTEIDTGEFGEIPDSQVLRPAGHSRIDCAVLFTMKGKTYYDCISSYGTLRVEPMSQEVIRVTFTKKQGQAILPPCSEMKPKKPVKFASRETRDAVEILTEKVLVRVEKKTGAVSFLTPKGKLLLSERAKEPRQLEVGHGYVYFDWAKNEKLIARGGTDKEFRKMTGSAAYISFGKKQNRMAGIASENGYELMFPAGNRVLCCHVSMYGYYVGMEGCDCLDYYFKAR